jgi:flagellar biogenesis protein FliO
MLISVRDQVYLMEELVVQVAGFMLMGGLIAFIIFIAWQFNKFINALEKRSYRKEQERLFWGIKMDRKPG